MKNVALHNLGCKVNSYEMDVMQQKLEEKGYKIVPFDEKADIYIINTCTVTNIADRKSRQMLHRAKKQNPDAVVVAVGCYVQTGMEAVEKDDCIDLAIGNRKKKDVVLILEEYLRRRKPDEGTGRESALAQSDAAMGQEGITHRTDAAMGQEGITHRTDAAMEQEDTVHQSDTANPSREARKSDKTLKNTTVLDLSRDNEYESVMLLRTAEHTRAYIKLQDGCNQFCSYCIIPFARGRVCSRTREDILTEITNLCDKGYQEFVFTGIHISSYGMDFSGQAYNTSDMRGNELLELIKAAARIEGVKRLRLGSLEPSIVTEKFAQELSLLEPVCPHFHLSLQSGCDATLKRMNRRYTTAEFEESVQMLRKYFDKPAITTDVIAGFPGETEEEFAQTKAFLEKIRFFEMHIFPYSKRQKTVAATMKGQLTEAVKKERSRILLELGRQQSIRYRKSFLNKEEKVLLEEEKEIGGKRYMLGHTERYVRMAVEQKEGQGYLSNQMVKGTAVEMLSEDILLLRVIGQQS